ncbi:primosomal protein N' [Roseofilum capinflatum]|uniref:Replication restart protein PriA n=1 Tax=Roseofilum capinflatum BLCC-M114 TaxID=3022440 RepID=A0ABT7B6B6_9CYAN|nr:primosomal protein N' [Roseofilum capinflatum]MDJ1174717.1 primosomal protein N' [Roseofilum capinflatum BLCC-M114]
MISKLDRLQTSVTSFRVAASNRPFYGESPSSANPRWVEVLVDYDRQEVEDQKLYTYAISSNLPVQPGDILSVPFGRQQLGAIAIRLLSAPPADLPPEKIKSVHEVISAGFFPPSYWQLLNQVAHYYHTPLMRVIRMALPPGLLGKSQRRIRLTNSIPTEAQVFLHPPAQQLLNLLTSSKTGEYSWRYLKQQVRQAQRGLQDLLKRQWVESYLEPPKPPRPKRQQVVTLVKFTVPEPEELTPRQQEILNLLGRQGGELLLTELLEQGQTSSGLIKTLEQKQWVVIEEQEQLRSEAGPMPDRDTAKPLTPAQTQALQAIQGRSGYHPFLLHGITGSGKTEVYLQAIAPILEQGQSILVLVPEIGLTPQLTDRFRARFGAKIRVYHSALSDGERYDTWRQMLQGTPQIVIGTRSAVFAPLPRLGLIILDEEHDTSFKQSQPAPTYHARQVAQWRAQLENCPLILGSATPSMETWFSSRSGTCTRLSLPERVENRPLPPISVVDLRRELKQGNRSIFSRSLQDHLRGLRERQQQGILFIPRRGHSTFVSCRSCGHVLECPHCDVSLSYHYTHEGASKRLRCHYCNFSQLQPSHCPECQSPYLKHFGTGTQRVTQELAKLFPELRVIRFDSDTTRTKNAHRTLLTRFVQGEADLLVGTQMLTKGLDIPGVTLVGVVAADGLLHQGDYRAGETAVQILTQVSGRAGRGDDPGQVIIQTYSPDHPAIQAVQNNAYDRFMEQELKEREAYHYPPYSSLVLFRFSGLDLMEVQTAAQQVAEVLESRAGNYQVLGPAPARVMRVSDAYRWQILLKFPPGVEINLPTLAELRSLCSTRVGLHLDIDPLNFG